MKKILLTLSLALFAAPAANAGFMIEPYVGYETGDFESGSTKDDYTGIMYGARLGYGMLGFSFGVDYSTGSGEVDDTPSFDAEPTDLGAFIAYEFPIMLRVYATYIVDAKIALDSGTDDIEEGSGTKFGIGWTGLPFVVINLEMTKKSYDKQGNNDIDAEINSYALVVSIPLP